ncbi:MAG: AraC family transcriptional regulator [Acetivibrionales bacterium]
MNAFRNPSTTLNSRLNDNIDIEKAAREAFMSCSNYYRIFFALTGYSVKEYIRHRRISEAIRDIKKTDASILEIALNYGFESNEAFTRAFRRITGYPPSAFRNSNLNFSFERVNILEKYFDIQDKELLEKYPDIKVLKELGPFRVAYYCCYGPEPEKGAFSVMSDWLKRSGLNFEKDKLRIFGFNNPGPAGPDQTEYGYEVWVTIGDDVVVNDSLVKTKIFQGGLYAVCGVKNLAPGKGGPEIHDTWQRFDRWLNESKYVHGDHQWLEEHLYFNDEFEHTGGMDLYMPVAQRESLSVIDKEVVFIEPVNTVTITFNGENAYDEALAFMYEFAGKPGDGFSREKRRFFCYYNHERAGKKDFWCKVHVTVKDEFDIKDDRLRFEIFEGGQYAYEEAEWENNARRWYQLIDWVKMSKKYDFDNRPFMEEFVIDSPSLKPTTRVKHFMPVKNK